MQTESRTCDYYCLTTYFYLWLPFLNHSSSNTGHRVPYYLRWSHPWVISSILYVFASRVFLHDHILDHYIVSCWLMLYFVLLLLSFSNNGYCIHIHVSYCFVTQHSCYTCLSLTHIRFNRSVLSVCLRSLASSSGIGLFSKDSILW